MDIPDRLIDLYRFPGFEPRSRIVVDPAWPDGVILTLDRRPQKGPAASAANRRSSTTTPAGDTSATSPAATAPSRCTSPFIDSSAIGVAA